MEKKQLQWGYWFQDERKDPVDEHKRDLSLGRVECEMGERVVDVTIIENNHGTKVDFDYSTPAEYTTDPSKGLYWSHQDGKSYKVEDMAHDIQVARATGEDLVRWEVTEDMYVVHHLEDNVWYVADQKDGDKDSDVSHNDFVILMDEVLAMKNSVEGQAISWEELT